MEIYDNWREEKKSAYLYRVMASHETNLLHKKLFTDLNAAAENQAKSWEKKIAKENLAPPSPYSPDKRTLLVAFLIKKIGAESMHAILSAMKIRGMSVFKTYQGHVPHTERKHTRFGAANNLRAAVFGINDGLVSNLSLLLGMIGANANQHTLILAGISGLLAGACSMGAGEYISVRSQREVFEYQIAIEEEELREYPEEEIEELSLIYQARGVPQQDAQKLAKLMIENPETGLNTLAREELGINPEDMVSPVSALLFSFFSFAIGAFVPVAPFFLGNSTHHIIISIAMTGTTLFVIGMILSLFTNKNPILLGIRMLLVGSIAGGLTYLIGHLLST